MHYTFIPKGIIFTALLEIEFQMYANELLVFHIERPVLGDNPKPHKFARTGRLPSSVTEAIEMVKKQCHVWSPMCTNFASFNKATARPIWDKTKNKNFMKSGAIARNCNPMFHLVILDHKHQLVQGKRILVTNNTARIFFFSQLIHFSCSLIWKLIPTSVEREIGLS